jgi:Flp pilus assembly pilin Flp
MKRRLKALKGRKGQTLVEYALILAFIAVVAIAVLYALGYNVTGIFSGVSTALQSAASSH